MRDEEVNELWRDLLCRDHEVAFVLAVLRIKHDHGKPRTKSFKSVLKA
jgi:hypothetical protein